MTKFGNTEANKTHFEDNSWNYNLKSSVLIEAQFRFWQMAQMCPMQLRADVQRL